MKFTTVPPVPVRASSLFRDDRVILDPDEMPYLVDAVEDTPHGMVRVTFSSFDVKEYAPDALVMIIDADDRW